MPNKTKTTPKGRVPATRVLKVATVKIGPAISKDLHTQLVQIATENGRSQRFLLERAIEHYIDFIAPLQTTVRPEIMAHFQKSVTKHRKLYELLADPTAVPVRKR